MATEGDAPAIAAIYAPFCEQTPISFEVVAPSPGQMAERIHTLEIKYPWLVLEVDGEVRGYVYSSAHRDRAAYAWSVDVSAYVDRGHKREGIGRALYTTLLELLRHQGYCKAYAGITLPNPASVGLHEAVGFSLVGTYKGVGFKFGTWHDVAWYQRPLRPEQVGPPTPVPVSAIRGTSPWNEAIEAGLRIIRDKMR